MPQYEDVYEPPVLDTTGQDMLTQLTAMVTKLQGIIDGLSPTAAGVSVSNTGMHIVTEDDVQGAISELDSAVDAVNASLAQKVNVAILTANLTIDYADGSSIGYRTTETTKIDITTLTGYPTEKTYIGAVAQATDIYGTLVWIDNSKYLRGASKTSKTVGVNVYVFYI